jgi:hypothetical protein
MVFLPESEALLPTPIALVAMAYKVAFEAMEVALTMEMKRSSKCLILFVAKEKLPFTT